MVDRQDIDALLISALYGELTPADEARLSTHLESHPADRTALADLTRARNALLESRILTVQLEPPQSISALLLQEAARRAPKVVAVRSEEREGWFQRFVRSFASRPMMAAAAMLVVLLGVAGTVKMAGRDAVVERAERTVAPSPPDDDRPALALESETAVGGGDKFRDQAAPAAQAATGSSNGASFDVTLREEGRRAEPPKVTTKTTTDTDGKVRGKSDAAKDALAQGNENTYLEVQTQRPNKPNVLDAEEGDGDTRRLAGAKKSPAQAPEQPQADPPKAEKGETVNAPGAGGGGANRDVAPDVSRTPNRTTPPITTNIPTGRVNTEDTKEEDLSAARAAHNEVVAAVKANDCTKASKLAADLAARAPGYYQTQVHTDREIKNCISHINNARDARDKAGRARVQQQKRVDERSAPKGATRR